MWDDAGGEVVELRGEGGGQTIHPFHQRQGESVKVLPGRGESNSPGASIEQRGPHLVLQLAQVQPHDLRIEEEAFRRLGDAPEPCDAAQRAQRPQPILLVVPEVLLVTGHGHCTLRSGAGLERGV